MNNIFKKNLVFLVGFIFINYFLLGLKLGPNWSKNRNRTIKSFKNLVIIKKRFYSNRTDSELAKSYIKYIEKYGEKKNIKSYAFTTNYIFHAELSAILDVIADKKKPSLIELYKKYYKKMNYYLLNYMTMTGKSKKESRRLRYKDAYDILSFHSFSGNSDSCKKIYKFLLDEQIKYNKKQKIYSKNLVSFFVNFNFILHIAGKEYKKKWLAHKTKAKKAGWPAVDGAKY